MNELKSDIDALMKVQERDRAIYNANQDLETIPEEIAVLKDSLEAEKVTLKGLEAALTTLQLKQKEKELELGQKEAAVKKLEGQLAQIKTNKEYSALQQEIASLKADNSLLEEEIIKIFDEVEAAQEEIAKEKGKLKAVESQYAEQENAFKIKEKELKTSIEQLQRERAQGLEQVDEEIRTQYDAIVAKRNGIALAKVVGEICDACKIKLRPQILDDVVKGEVIVICESCNRILYSDPQTEYFLPHYSFFAGNKLKFHLNDHLNA